MSNTCFFCNKEINEHNENDVDNCLRKFRDVEKS